MATFPQIDSPPQASAEVIVNEALETLEHQAVYGKDQATTSALTWGYYGGRWGGFSVAAGTFTLTNSVANYIVVAIATGVTTASTSATNWNDTANYVRVYKVTCAGGVVSAVEDHRAGPGGVHGPGALASNPTECIVVAMSDETTALTTGTKVTMRMPYAFTITSVRASVTTAPTGGTLLGIDIKEAGTTIFSTKPTFDASEKTTTTAATPNVVSDASLADDAEITFLVDAVGSTIAGAGLKAYLIGHRT